jgi:hypothetical protein
MKIEEIFLESKGVLKKIGGNQKLNPIEKTKNQ